MLDVLSSHRTYNEAEDNVAKLVPCRKWDEWVVNFGRTRRLEVGHGGQLQYGYPWIRCIQLSRILKHHQICIVAVQHSHNINGEIDRLMRLFRT